MEYFTVFLTAVFTAGIYLYYFVVRKLSYFEHLKIPHVRPISILGNMTPFIFQRVAMADNLVNIYNLFPDAKYFGFFEFMRPKYVIRDPDLINSITIRNFDYFCDHEYTINEKFEPIVKRNLFILRGNEWYKMRKVLSPSFTSNKMKKMFELMCKCAENFMNFIERENNETYDMEDMLSKYSNDVIATCAFGISVDSFKDPNNNFYLLGKKAISFANPRVVLASLINRNFRTIANLFKIKVFSAEVDNFFKDIVTSTVKVREEQGIVRPDMIQLMMESRNKDHGSMFDINEMTAQAFVFYFAGFDSTSRTMCFATHEIAVNPDIQRKLKKEIKDVFKKTNDKPTYEAIMGMKYLDAILNEVMRCYPPIYIDRMCVKEFELPPAVPNGKSITLKPGDSVWIPVYALHNDSKYYSQPKKFNPDRFLNDEVDKSVYLPFGVGRRMCIGYRFALMEMKIILFYLLWHYDLEPDSKTRNPIVLAKKSFSLMSENGFWLKIRAKKSSV